MSILRKCDYCERDEADVPLAFVQHYRILPTRPAPNNFPNGARTFDLCKECIGIITSVAASESVPAPRDAEPLRAAMRGGPVMVTDGKGKTRIVRERNRAGRCTSYSKSKCRCIWDEGHDGSHNAANGQRWASNL